MSDDREGWAGGQARLPPGGSEGEAELGRFLVRRLHAGELAAAEAAVWVAGRQIARARAGSLCWDTDVPLRGGELFDAASLTKPFVATLALVLDQTGALPLSTRITELLPSARPALGERTLEDLLRHRSGLAAWFPLETLDLPEVGLGGALGGDSKTEKLHRREKQEGGEEVGLGGAVGGDLEIEKLHRREEQEGGGRVARRAVLLEWFGGRAPLGARPGTYSDLGFLLWTLLAEVALGARLRDLLLSEVISPLGLRLGLEVGLPSDTEPVFARQDARGQPNELVECGLDGEREVELAAGLGIRIFRRADARWRGVPQDGNARFLGGVPGHAGLFVSVAALLALGREWLAPGAVLRSASVRLALSGSGGRHALGWVRRRRAGSAGPAFSRSAFGHTGFTGGSLWIDPQQGLIAALLAYRRSSAWDLGPTRRAFHRLAVQLASGVGGRAARAASDLR